MVEVKKRKMRNERNAYRLTERKENRKNRLDQRY